MNKDKFHDKKQQKPGFQGQGNKPQWPGQNNPNQDPKQNPSHNPGQNPNKPEWPQKDKR